MSGTETLDKLARDVRARLDTIPSTEEMSDAARAEVERFLTSDDFLRDTLREILPDLLGSDDELADVVRKIKFPDLGSEAPELRGSKYAALSAADVEWLYDVMRSAQRNGVGGAEGPSEELTRAFEAVSQSGYRTVAEMQRADRDAIERWYERSGDRAGYEQALRAMDTAESGYGAELVGAQYVGELWEAPKRLGRVFPLIPTFEMTDPTAYLPVEAGLPELLLVSESTANNSSNYDTVKTGSNRVQVDAKKFVIHQMYSGEMEEDSIIAFVPFLRRQAAVALAHYLDSLVLNGDTTNAGTGNINLDDADPADTKHYLAFDGIRHAALVDNTANAAGVGSGIGYTDITGLRALMLDTTYLHDWGHPVDPEDLVFVADPETADDVAELEQVLTVEKYGERATVLNGEVGRIGRNPFIPSIAVSKTEADGKVSTTPGNNTKGQIVAFNRRGYAAGWRRQVQTEMERLPGTDQTRIVYSLRLGFGRFSPTGAAAGIESAAVAYNITV